MTGTLPQSFLGRLFARYSRELAIGFALCVLLVVMAVQAPAFFRPDHLRDKLVANVPVLIAAIGMTLVIISKQIDISIGSQVSVCGVVAALAAQNGMPLVVVVSIAVLCGCLFGLINGWLVANLQLPAIVVTLATMVIWQQSLRWWREGEPVRGLQDTLQWFGLSQIAGQWTIVGIAAVVFFVTSIWLFMMRSGRAVYAIGSSTEAARLVGLRPQRVLLWVFVAMGAASGLAALLGRRAFW